MVARRFAWMITAALLAGAPAHGAPGDAERGEEIYVKRCMNCHGEEGDGLGPGAERLNPPPRDFTLGLYKIKTTGFDDPVPNDADIYRMIEVGMPGTSMPGWGDVLSEQEILDLVAYLKVFAELEEEEPTEQLDYGTAVASSADSIEIGRKLFLDGDRCSECHGVDGRGDAIKKLKDDNGERTWPRNLTKPWTFIAGNDPKEIFARISVGIPGTQMPSFADPKSKKKLSVEERWHIANFTASLADPAKTVRAEKTVIKAAKIDGELPSGPEDPAWAAIEAVNFFMVPQMFLEERFFTPSNDTVSARALYNDRAIAFLLEWDDRTRSTPGDAAAEKIADPGIAEDGIAIQLPVSIPEDMEKPYFVMGDAADPVNFWHWRGGTAEEPESVALYNARGLAEVEERDAAAAGIAAKGAYKAGTWRVMMTRELTTSDAENDLQFEEGRFIPIAFSAWDGSNSERGSRRTVSTWYWLLLEPSVGSKPIVAALIVIVLLLGAELWWARSATRKGT